MGLDGEHDGILLNWLEYRRVQSESGESQILPFADLDTWVDAREDDLLPALNERYTAMVADQLQTDDMEGLEQEGIIRRSGIIFERLWTSGEESRAGLWEQLNKFVSLRIPAAVELASDTMNSHRDAPDSQCITSFLDEFAVRLNRDIDDPDNWELDWESRGLVFLDILNARHEVVGSQASESIVTLGKSWSQIDDAAQFSVRVYIRAN